MKFCDAKRFPYRKRVMAKLLDRVKAAVSRGFAMAARVIPHDPEMFEQFRNLRIPEMKIGAERIGEHQSRSALAALNKNVERFAANHDCRHAPARIPDLACVIERGAGIWHLTCTLILRRIRISAVQGMSLREP